MRKQILLIDDDLPLCRQLGDALQDDTTEVRYFIDTAEALDSFMRQRYCLVIMDSTMEDMDGRELLRTMRQAKAAPILVLTDTLLRNQSMDCSGQCSHPLLYGVGTYREKILYLDLWDRIGY